MSLVQLASVLRERARLRSYDHWSREVILAQQVVDEGIEGALAAVCVRGVFIRVVPVDAIPKAALGKAPLIRRERSAPADHRSLESRWTITSTTRTSLSDRMITRRWLGLHEPGTTGTPKRAGMQGGMTATRATRWPCSGTSSGSRSP